MPEIIPIPDEGLGNHSYLVELEVGVLVESGDPSVAEQMAHRRTVSEPECVVGCETLISGTS